MRSGTMARPPSGLITRGVKFGRHSPQHRPTVRAPMMAARAITRPHADAFQGIRVAARAARTMSRSRTARGVPTAARSMRTALAVKGSLLGPPTGGATASHSTTEASTAVAAETTTDVEVPQKTTHEKDTQKLAGELLAMIENDRDRRLREVGEADEPAELLLGRVQWYDGDRRFGFLLPDNGVQEIFFHKSKMSQLDVENIRHGDRVEFVMDEKDAQGRTSAAYVRRIVEIVEDEDDEERFLRVYPDEYVWVRRVTPGRRPR
mmetsp:Transcript_9867/g.25070  ORF Transcript_9867/g.25070 Transcript_9867/m.25070 type:complete len:263 (+) Transcript_9867:20-808(+)